jgi:hypothetical protein
MFTVARETTMRLGRLGMASFLLTIADVAIRGHGVLLAA